jgi:hypothetical protein
LILIKQKAIESQAFLTRDEYVTFWAAAGGRRSITTTIWTRGAPGRKSEGDDQRQPVLIELRADDLR